MTITELAKKYSEAFTTDKRDDGTEFVHLKETFKPEELHDSIRQAHGDRFPDDWIYGTYADLLQNITEYELETIEDLEEVRSEIVDTYTDVYTSQLTEWLHSDNRNVYYLTEVLEEYGTIEDSFQLLRLAQYKAIDEVMNEIISLLGKEEETEAEVITA